MTDPNGKPRTRNTNGPITVGVAFDRIRERLRTQPARELAHAKEFLLAEAEWLCKIAARVPAEHRGELAAMLVAVKAHSAAGAVSTLVPAPEQEDDHESGKAAADDEPPRKGSRIVDVAAALEAEEKQREWLNEQPAGSSAIEKNNETGEVKRRTVGGAR